MFDNLINWVELTNQELLKSGDINSDEYEDKIIELREMTQESNNKLKSGITVMKKEGIGITYFIGRLVYRLFFIAIYCAILAFFVRKKEKFIKTN